MIYLRSIAFLYLIRHTSRAAMLGTSFYCGHLSLTSLLTRQIRVVDPPEVLVLTLMRFAFDRAVSNAIMQ